MRKVLTVAKRELKRFRSRFSGGSRAVMLGLIAVSLLVSYFVAQQGLVLGKDIYTVGVSPDGPIIEEPRFKVITLDRGEGLKMLGDGSIDLYLDGETAYSRRDERSQYAEGALKKYLEGAETARLIGQYDINRSFPLRIHASFISSQPATPTPEATAAATVMPSPSASTDTGAAVQEQIKEATEGGSRFKAEFVSEDEVMVPSLMRPPLPLSQVILAFIYVVPILFLGIFYSSSFIEEKINRKLNVLLSAPVTPFDIIAGKTLPYVALSLGMVAMVTLALGGDVALALAIFFPIILFIFSVYLLIALAYRTFKDQTFFSMAAITFVTGYLVLPALLTGINDVCYVSPLTLAVQMYRGEVFSLMEYALSTGPMYILFAVSAFVGVRVFSEEYLMSYGPLYRRAADAIYLAIDKGHPYLSVALLSALLIPAVFMAEMIIAILSLMVPVSLPPIVFLAMLLSLCVIVEEAAKSAGIATLIENGKAKSIRGVLGLSAASAFGFFVGEKLLLYLSLSVVSNVMLLDALRSSGLLIVPLLAHFIFTSIVCLFTLRLGVKRYPLAIAAGSFVHFLYNFIILLGEMGAI